MVKKALFTVTGILLFLTGSFGQTAVINLNDWAEANPIQKLYLHTDLENYYAGGTIWFKGYFLAEYRAGDNNTSVYVELVDNQFKRIVRNVFPVFFGTTVGQLDLPENLTTGSYILRAYSPLMLNQSGFVFSKRIVISGKEAKTAPTKITPAVTISFFPEGGNLISSLINTVAFKVTDERGLPLNLQGEIWNNKNEMVTTFFTMHDGMGAFNIVPQPEETYFAITTGPDGEKRYPLPAATKNGITFSMKSTAKGKEYRIEQLDGNDNFKAAYMVAQMNNTVLFKWTFKPGKNFFGGTITTKDLMSGTMQLTVFNKFDQPLAERITFVDNQEYILPATLTTDTLNFGERSRNHFSLSLKDTIVGNFSAAITDADYETDASRSQNIYSSLMLTNDLKGYVHRPAQYFGDSPDSLKKYLDLVMMTNGWTRFKWSDAIANTLPKPLFTDLGYITLNGKVTFEGSRRAFANKELIMLLKPKDSTQKMIMQMIHTDSTGSFKVNSAIFYNKTSILLSDVKGKKSKYIKVKYGADSLQKNFPVLPTQIPYISTDNDSIAEKMGNAYNDYLKVEGVMLANVTVRTRQKSNTEKLDDAYASGMFAGGINSRILDLTQEVAMGSNIFDYLQGRIAGLTVSRDSQGQYQLTYRDGGLGKGNVKLFLDESPTDAVFIEAIPVNQIAFVKLFPNFVGAPGGGSSLAIYMKKGADLNAAIEAPTDVMEYNGYTVVKEFYSPNYAVRLPEHSKADNRITLLWQPYITLANVNPVVPIGFYNNDRSTKYKIVIEGMTTDGRLLMFEKTVHQQK